MTEKNRILVALKNKAEAEDFRERLTAKEFEVVSVKDGAETLESALKDTPSVIVIDLELPVMDGSRVFSILRRNNQTASIPFIFISDTVADLNDFKVGTDTFLLRPFNPEEVFGRISQVLMRNVAGSAGGKEIEGKLSQMSVPDIIQFLHLNQKEGELRVTSGNMLGTVYVKDGEVQNAVLDSSEKDKALFRLLDWKKGEFEFTPTSVHVTKKINTPTGNLLMEGMRQLDELKSKADRFPRPTSRLTQKVKPDELKKGLDPVFYELARILKLYNNVADVVDHSSFSDFEVYKALAVMISEGMVEEEKTGGGEDDGVFTLKETLALREKITGRFTDIMNLNYARVLLITTSGCLVDDFIAMCARIPGFYVDTRTIFSQVSTGERFGEVARLRLVGGLDVVVFSIPHSKNMGPILKAFSTNLVGLIVLAGGDGKEEAGELIAERDEVLALKEVPRVHVFFKSNPGGESSDETSLKKAFGLKSGDPVIMVDDKNDKAATGIFQTLLGSILQ